MNIRDCTITLLALTLAACAPAAGPTSPELSTIESGATACGDRYIGVREGPTCPAPGDAWTVWAPYDAIGHGLIEDELERVCIYSRGPLYEDNDPEHGFLPAENGRRQWLTAECPQIDVDGDLVGYKSDLAVAILDALQSRRAEPAGPPSTLTLNDEVEVGRERRLPQKPVGVMQLTAGWRPFVGDDLGDNYIEHNVDVRFVYRALQLAHCNGTRVTATAGDPDDPQYPAAWAATAAPSSATCAGITTQWVFSGNPTLAAGLVWAQ